jgi:glucose-1-phosphate adenylyltransferase
MGVYVFRTEALYRLLDSNPGSDFGKHILPASLENCRVLAYPFDGYWEDIGTIRAFYDANLALLTPDPPFNFYDPERPIYTHPRFLPPSSVDEDCRLDRVMLAPGSNVRSSDLQECVVGLRSQIGPRVRMRRTIMMGADYFQAEAVRAGKARPGDPPIGVGADCVIEGAILDKNARVGAGTTIRARPDRPDQETGQYVVRDGIVIVMKNAVIPPGTVI